MGAWSPEQFPAWNFLLHNFALPVDGSRVCQSLPARGFCRLHAKPGGFLPPDLEHHLPG